MSGTQPRKKKPASGTKVVTGSSSAMRAGTAKSPPNKGGTKVC